MKEDGCCFVFSQDCLEIFSKWQREFLMMLWPARSYEETNLISEEEKFTQFKWNVISWIVVSSDREFTHWNYTVIRTAMHKNL